MGSWLSVLVNFWFSCNTILLSSVNQLSGEQLALSHFRDGPLEKLWGGEGNFRATGIFFPGQIPCMNCFLSYSMNIFLGLIGVQEFFPFNFPLREFFFCTSPAPPISFLMVRPLYTRRTTINFEISGYIKYCNAIFWETEGLGEECVKTMQIVSCLELMVNLFIFIHNGGI